MNISRKQHHSTLWLVCRLLPGRQTYVLDKAGKVALSFNDQVLFTTRLLLTRLGCQCEQQSKLHALNLMLHILVQDAML